MRRIRMTVSYDGTEFHGWQVQPGLPTVQSVLETVLAEIEGAPPVFFGCVPDFTEHFKNGRHRPCRDIDRRCQRFGQHARCVVCDAAAGNVGRTFQQMRGD